MNALPTRRDLQQLLANTGVSLPESKSVWSQEAINWTALVLIHVALLLAMWDILVRLRPLTH
ncbi:MULTISPECIES: hypothetical protein [unclassified Spirosoma]|uniref:hypothetical protein n=1 Tax=unclassified Spirosoma TaxID=2621999 RepID=UPI000B1FA5C7|nr:MULTISPECIES: hypothetical protein [unclassified Spirosoma]MBN8824329.1 hypothetical protein [Spirosoma sp.]